MAAARTASTAAYRVEQVNSKTTWMPSSIAYAHGHSPGDSATDSPIATDCPIPINAASRTAVPVSSSTASADSANNTPQPNAVKYGSTACSITQLNGVNTGCSTARCVK
ncbi:Uncharacterised protein [Mycobacterium tuberculosis]|uniref:Uncharacterized protein n=1 Tax=Mycobacterium tuberculosis TaxID=1773 RepID=A0A0T9CWC1_MYCTX|nr:Uncharacterised protein [Mycobacterium tuberculosis]CFE35011.1 Uncharacterised protein [Mycobacterium tuberculosis]CFS34250.1 Uncharacterised protein [Mycobacterium tuberculosis]CKN18807.1 Uncharacterised protein [Mycobacterium tuberculosis]CKN25198.1 Uncharacterised protein [Mycobacterium tuberculosis]